MELEAAPRQLLEPTGVWERAVEALAFAQVQVPQAGQLVEEVEREPPQLLAVLKVQHGDAPPELEHLAIECDIYCPCARGAGLNDETIPLLRCKAVAGCANNQLLEPRHAADLMNRGIIYAPDYVINAAGIINVAAELWDGGYDRDEVLRRIRRIPEALDQVWTLAVERGIPASEAAGLLAEETLAEARMAGC